ncbi:hypothetical protein GCM10027053_21510 [Intrasporangium mesophilum]
MSTQPLRLSVPPPRKQTPRPLTDGERAVYTAIADVLCSGDGSAPPPSQCPEFDDTLDLALATRSDSFDGIVRTIAQAPEGAEAIQRWLRSLHDNAASDFQVLSAVAAGAYLMVPEIRTAVGYPGQRRNPPKAEEAIDEIMDGILDPVLERGFFYVPTPGQERSP